MTLPLPDRVFRKTVSPAMMPFGASVTVVPASIVVEVVVIGAAVVMVVVDILVELVVLEVALAGVLVLLVVTAVMVVVVLAYVVVVALGSVGKSGAVLLKHIEVATFLHMLSSAFPYTISQDVCNSRT
jgi:hypothetical protein